MRPLGTRTGNYEAFRYANRQEVHKGSHILPPPPPPILLHPRKLSRLVSHLFRLTIIMLMTKYNYVLYNYHYFLMFVFCHDHL